VCVLLQKNIIKMSLPQIGCFITGQPPTFDFQITNPETGQMMAQINIPTKPGLTNQFLTKFNLNIFLTSRLPSDDQGFEINLGLPDDSWSGLGYLSNEKASNSFNISIPENINEQLKNCSIIAIGLQYTDLNKLKHQYPDENDSVEAKFTRAGKVANRVVQHLQNFAGSFVLSTSDISDRINSGQARLSDEYVPVKAFEKWLDSLTRRLQNDPDFK